MEKPVLIVINPRAHQGKAWKRWKKIRNQLMEVLPGFGELVMENGFDLKSALVSLSRGGHMISAGGDGSIHFLINELLKDGTLDKTKISVGAIGLGSSNDFHKPFQSAINGIPVRINTQKADWHDVGKLRYINEYGRENEKYFIVNASFGATAQGNWNFNNPGPLLRLLKKTNTALAIQYTSLSTIFSFVNKTCYIQYGEVNKSIPVSNINILKIPFVAGSLHYKQSIQPDDGRMGLNICMDMSRYELVQTLMGLQKGKFIENEKRLSTHTDHFILESVKPIVFECDGETEKATRVEISLIPKAIQILSS